MSGYMGKLLIVDLTRGRLWDEPINPSWARDFVGGAGYAARYLYDELGPGTDPLGPDNTLMFMTGPLVGTRAPSCGRHEVCALSPQTGLWGESNSGGFWGAELKFSGYDGIVIRGQSPKPVWLSIIDGQPSALHDAGSLWGHGLLRDAATPARRAGRSEGAGSEHRPGGREPGAVRGDHERPWPGSRPDRHGRGDGLEKAQGDCRPRQTARAAGRQGEASARRPKKRSRSSPRTCPLRSITRWARLRTSTWP